MTEQTFEDDLSEAFSIAGRTASAQQREDAFERVGRFRLQAFSLGEGSALAEIAYFPNQTETVADLKGWQSLTMSWGLDQLRLLVNELPEGEERTYLSTVEDALSTYSWLQWAVQDTGSHMLPDGDLSEIGRRTRELMEKLRPIRNRHALMPERRPRHHAPA